MGTPGQTHGCVHCREGSGRVLLCIALGSPTEQGDFAADVYMPEVNLGTAPDSMLIRAFCNRRYRERSVVLVGLTMDLEIADPPETDR